MSELSDILRRQSSSAIEALSRNVSTDASTMRKAARTVVQLLGDAEAPAPPAKQLEELRVAVERAWQTSRRVRDIDARLRKRIPLVLFFPEQQQASWLANDDNLCRDLIEWISEKQRGAVALSLVREFLRKYPNTLPTVAMIRQGLRYLVSKPELARPGTFLERCREWGYFEADGPRKIASVLLGDERTPAGLWDEAGLGGALSQSRFSRAVLDALLTSAEERAFDKPQLVERVTTLVQDGKTLRFSDPDFRSALASALLAPYHVRDPSSESLREGLKRFFLRHFGDPRARDSRWNSASDVGKEVMTRWLVRESFDLFFNIIDRTADDNHWRYRRPFWEKYLTKGLVVDAWAVLGRQAVSDAQRRGLTNGKYGVMRGAYSNQSALLMRLRGKKGAAVVAEWSHNGKCRIWLGDSPRAPQLYTPQYTPDALRISAEMEFSHIGSDRGRWQSQIRSELWHTFGIEV